MSYQVIARRWRPKSFDDVVGQRHVTDTLRSAIRLKRIAHAYLFSGPRGVGKTTTARLLSKALNCKDGPTENPCNECTSCNEISISRSMDVLEIDGASNRGIEQIRELRENVKYAPVLGKYKIYIVDEVHMLTTEAFNALLKTLEEPPPHVVFIFATTESHRVPLTILSRCQRYDFRRISTSEIMSRLKKIALEEKGNFDENCLLFISRRADGSMRDAESLLDLLIASFPPGESITEEKIREILGVVKEEVYGEILEAFSRKDSREAIQIAERVLDGGADSIEFVNGLLNHLKNLFLIRIGADIELTPDEKKRYNSEAPNLVPEDILRMTQILGETERTMKFSSQSRTFLILTLARLAKLDSTVDLTKLLQKLEIQPTSTTEKEEKEKEENLGSKHEPESGVSEEKQSEAESKVIEDTIDFAKIETAWQDFVEEVKRKEMRVGTFLEAGRPLFLSDDKMLSIGFGNSFYKDQVERKHKGLLENELYSYFKIPLRIGCKIYEKDESSIKSKDSVSKTIKESDEKEIKSEEIEEAKRNGMLKIFIDTFGGEIV